MRREVSTEQTDRVFRDKVLQSEQGPFRVGEPVPTAFDWSAIPVPEPKMNISRMVWGALVVLAIIIVSTLVVRQESQQQSDAPFNNIENAPKPESKHSTSAEKSQIMADNEPEQEDVESRGKSNSADATFGVSTGSSPESVGRDALSNSNNASSVEISGTADSVESGTLNTDIAVKGASSGTENTPVAYVHDGSGDDNIRHDAKGGVSTLSGDEIRLADQSGNTRPQTDTNTGTGTERNANASQRLIDSLDATNRTSAESDAEQNVSFVAAVPLVSGADIANSIKSTDKIKMPVPGVTVTASQLSQGNRFEVRVFSSLNQGYRVLSGNGSNEEVVDRINNNESASVNFGFGAHFGWHINSRWTVLTGVAKRTTTINYKFSKQVIYDRAKEIVNSSGDFENSEDFEFETSSGSSTARTSYAWRLLQNGLKNGDRVDFTFEFGREYHSVIVPLQVQYQIVNNAFKFGVIAGAQYARIYQTGIRPGRPQARIRPDQHPIPIRGRDFFTKNTFDVLLAERGLNKNVFEATLGLHFAYQFTKSLGIYVQPSYSHGLNNIYTSDNFSTIPTNKQIDAGVVLSF